MTFSFLFEYQYHTHTQNKKRKYSLTNRTHRHSFREIVGSVKDSIHKHTVFYRKYCDGYKLIIKIQNTEIYNLIWTCIYGC